MSGSDQRVIVTSQERVHPAIRKLARACIALARELAGQSATPPTPTGAPENTPTGQERAHD